jgi:hypothetical protein
MIGRNTSGSPKLSSTRERARVRARAPERDQVQPVEIPRF